MDSFHVLLQTLRQGEPLPTLADMRELLLVDNLDVPPESRGLVELPATLLAYNHHRLQVDGLVVLDHVALLVERFLTLRAHELLRLLMNGPDVGGPAAGGCKFLITIWTVVRLLSWKKDGS